MLYAVLYSTSPFWNLLSYFLYFFSVAQQGEVKPKAVVDVVNQRPRQGK
jgi:hypothetical protein